MPKHTHKYQKMAIGAKGYEVFKCMLPDCPHYLQKQLALGRETQCWACDKTLVIKHQHLAVSKPKCKDCVEKRKIALEQFKSLPEVDQLQEIKKKVNFEELLKG